MTHSPNLRYIKTERGEQGVTLNSKGAKKFDEAREKTISSKRGTSDGSLVKRNIKPEEMKALNKKHGGDWPLHVK
jgi:hypothetical protein